MSRRKGMKAIVEEEGVPTGRDLLAEGMERAIAKPAVETWMGLHTETKGDYALEEIQEETWGHHLNGKATRVSVERKEYSRKFRREPDFFIDVFRHMTMRQREFMIQRVGTRSAIEVYEAAESTFKIGIKEYQGWPPLVLEAIEFGAEVIRHDAQAIALQVLSESVAKAALIKAQGLDSADEEIRQAVATEILQMRFGKPGVRDLTPTEDKYSKFLERIALAEEKMAGIRHEEIEGDYVVDGGPGGDVPGSEDQAEREPVADRDGGLPDDPGNGRGAGGQEPDQRPDPGDVVDPG